MSEQWYRAESIPVFAVIVLVGVGMELPIVTLFVDWSQKQQDNKRQQDDKSN